VKFCGLSEGERSDSLATYKTPGKLDTVVQFSTFIVSEGVSNESTAKIQANEITNDCRVHK
jgi:hypothetical protein